MLFISYAHRDGRGACEEVRVMLQGACTEFGDKLFWYDGEIKVGERFPDRISHAMEKATGAILILTPDFLASEFIRRVELPTLVSRDIPLFPLYWSHCLVDENPNLKDIKRYPSEGSIESLNVEDRGAALVAFLSDIISQGGLCAAAPKLYAAQFETSSFGNLIPEVLNSLSDNVRSVLEHHRLTIRCKRVLSLSPEDWLKGDVSDLAEFSRRIIDAIQENTTLSKEQIAITLDKLADLEKLWRSSENPHHLPGEAISLQNEMIPLLTAGADAAEQLRSVIPTGALSEALADLLEALEWIEITQRVRFGDLSRHVQRVRNRASGCFDGGSRALMAAIGKRVDLAPPGAFLKDTSAPWSPEMVVIPSGHFRAMAPDVSGGIFPHYRSDGYDIEATVDNSFCLGRYAVTKAEFCAFVEETGHALGDSYVVRDGGGFGAETSNTWLKPGFKQEMSDPVVNVSWSDAQAYIKWLSEKTGAAYRLPTEWEWEYACRAGSLRSFSISEGLSYERANYGAVGRTQPVGSYPPNPWGLSEMHGNVWEWCESDEDSMGRVIRGGAWHHFPPGLPDSDRNWAHDFGFNSCGFRVARDIA